MNKPHCITCGGNHDGDFCPPAADPVLLPCPFCGSDAGYCTSTHDHGIDHIAVCNECPARIETGKKERTIEAWNRRSGFPPHPVLKAVSMSDAISIRVDPSWYMVPNKHHVLTIASGRTIYCTEVMWLNYMHTVRDLMLAGF